MKLPVPATVDFETETIVGRPDYPPKPVGVSIHEPGQRPKYWAWGHPCENNCTKAQARKELKRIYARYPLLFHNSKFDLDVGNVHMELPLIPKHGYHDTLFLAFLHDPHARELKLKTLANEHLDMPPEEQDKVAQWVLEHVWLSKKFSTGEYKIKTGGIKPKGWFKVPPTKTGAFIYLVPGKLAGRYANGDTIRTTKLFKFYWQSVINDYGMWEAYERELKLMPILLRSERQGIKTNSKKLRADANQWNSWVTECDRWIRRRVKDKNLNVDSGDELADAMEDAGKVDVVEGEYDWVLTDKGNRSVSKDNIAIACNDVSLVKVLDYRGTLVNSMRNFAASWLRMADANDGFISTNWNQVRQPDERGSNKGTKGARTGRLSSNPNFQNVSKNPKRIILPKTLIAKGLGDLPYLRSYITADMRGHILLNRDYSQQELRILGHFEDGVLLKAYNDDPKLDIHDMALHLINNMLGTDFDRHPIKTMGFGLVYGMGIALLAETMGVDEKTARILKKAYLRIFPGLKELDDDLKHRGRMREFIQTWGGRCYYVEPPRIVKDRVRTFEYKLLNVLIQGSAADCTKEAIIRYDDIHKDGRLLLTVHDELMIDAPTKCAVGEMKLLKEAMESVEFDVPMLSTGKKGFSWGDMKKCA